MSNTKRIEQAREVLGMIEVVDHTDSKQCLDLNSRGYCIFSGMDYERVVSKGNIRYCLDEDYSRSRDALKAARPEGWKFSIKWEWTIDRYVCTGCSDYKKPNSINTQYAKVCSPYLEGMTEELAEFHAIVQAWIYVWENEA